MNLIRRAFAEAVGTALLLAGVVGSGIMGERLAGGSVALALLANALATGAALVPLILAFGPISGAHFNPAVTVAQAIRQQLSWRAVPLYLLSQCVGAVVGVLLVHLMFAEPLVSLSIKVREGPAQLLSEGVATFGLLLVIFGVARSRPAAMPYAVGAWIVAAYWFTPSTSFANPAATVARALTGTFAGIRPGDVPGFVVAQAGGVVAALLVGQILFPVEPATADNEHLANKS